MEWDPRVLCCRGVCRVQILQILLLPGIGAGDDSSTWDSLNHHCCAFHLREASDAADT